MTHYPFYFRLILMACVLGWATLAIFPQQPWHFLLLTTAASLFVWGMVLLYQSKDWKILLGWAQLGRTVPRLSRIEACAGPAAGGLRFDDSYPLSAESPLRSYRWSTGICVRRTAGNLDCRAEVPQVRKHLLPAGRNIHYTAIAVRVSPYRYCR